jgi:hypothetical protein
MALPRKIRGLRDNIPGGFVIGRTGKGKGAPTLIPFKANSKGVLGGPTAASASANQIAIEIFAAGLLAISETIGQIIAPVGFTLLATLPGSYAKARIASTGTVVLTIYQNTTSIGTITFTASATGVFSFVADVTFVAGDFLRITTPGAADATLNDVTARLVGIM